MRLGFTSGAIAATSNLIPVIQPMASSFQNPTKFREGSVYAAPARKFEARWG